MIVDREKSKEIAKAIKAKPKQCWLNAFRAIQKLPPEAMYIEGWALGIDDLIIEHAWLELNGAIIDPTLYENPPSKFYPGLRFTALEMTDAAQRAGELPIAWTLNKYNPEKYKDYENAFYLIQADLKATPATIARGLIDDFNKLKAEHESNPYISVYAREDYLDLVNDLIDFICTDKESQARFIDWLTGLYEES